MKIFRFIVIYMKERKQKQKNKKNKKKTRKKREKTSISCAIVVPSTFILQQQFTISFSFNLQRKKCRSFGRKSFKKCATKRIRHELTSFVHVPTVKELSLN